MDTVLTSIFGIGNLLEGIFWCCIAVGFVVVFLRRRKNADLMLTSALVFAAFGISDFIEITTGGWYKPWWLLLWKGACLLWILPSWWLFRRRRAMTADAAQRAADAGLRAYPRTYCTLVEAAARRISNAAGRRIY